MLSHLLLVAIKSLNKNARFVYILQRQVFWDVRPCLLVTNPYASLPTVLKRGDITILWKLLWVIEDLGLVGEMKDKRKFFRIQWSQNGGRDENILWVTGDPQKAPSWYLERQWVEGKQWLQEMLSLYPCSCWSCEGGEEPSVTDMWINGMWIKNECTSIIDISEPAVPCDINF